MANDTYVQYVDDNLLKIIARERIRRKHTIKYTVLRKIERTDYFLDTHVL